MFNFLVAGNPEAWDDGVFVMPRERFAEYTDDSLVERYKSLSPEVLDELCGLPSLFCIEGEERPSRVGRITKISPRRSMVRIEFEFLYTVSPLPEGSVAENAFHFDVRGWELSRTHWAIKDGDLRAILLKKGLIQDTVEFPVALATEALTVEAHDAVEGQSVFVVHGHDETTKYAVANEIKNYGLTPIILHEQVSGGRTIIEKIERYTSVKYGVVIYTPCDRGAKFSTEGMALSPRARQNVVFEHGYLIAKLGRAKVAALVKGSVEVPSDISGLVYIPMDEKGLWKKELAKELRGAGLRFVDPYQEVPF